MNATRYQAATTPEGRLAAVVKEILYDFSERNRREGTFDIVDYVDLERVLKPYVQKELALARVAQVQELLRQSEETLSKQLAILEQQIKS
jgi:hypothetical protein